MYADIDNHIEFKPFRVWSFRASQRVNGDAVNLISNERELILRSETPEAKVDLKLLDKKKGQKRQKDFELPVTVMSTFTNHDSRRSDRNMTAWVFGLCKTKNRQLNALNDKPIPVVSAIVLNPSMKYSSRWTPRTRVENVGQFRVNVEQIRFVISRVNIFSYRNSDIFSNPQVHWRHVKEMGSREVTY